MLIVSDSVNTTTYISEGVYEGQLVLVEGDTPCPCHDLVPVCDTVPGQLYCLDCCGVAMLGEA